MQSLRPHLAPLNQDHQQMRRYICGLRKATLGDFQVEIKVIRNDTPARSVRVCRHGFETHLVATKGKKNPKTGSQRARQTSPHNVVKTASDILRHHTYPNWFYETPSICWICLTMEEKEEKKLKEGNSKIKVCSGGDRCLGLDRFLDSYKGFFFPFLFIHVW